MVERVLFEAKRSEKDIRVILDILTYTTPSILYNLL